ncbi:MAG: hypothetical protein LBH42_08450, partial [Treponema sp.]|nr:hypothetical protein [Treponema sp.]
MDERRNKIRDLEAKKQADIRAGNQLLEGLGESLFRRIGEESPFNNAAVDTPGGILVEYRGLQKEIAGSLDNIAFFEKEASRFKELEEAITAREEEKKQLDEELTEVYAAIGKVLFEDPEYHEATGASRRQEENLLARVEEQELKLGELEKREGGILTWLGKTTQMTISRTLLSRNRSALKRLYREAGERYISTKPVESLVGDHAGAAEKVLELKESLSSLGVDLSGLKGERREMVILFGTEGTPSRRIQKLEKHIEQVKGKFPVLNLRMGTLAAEDDRDLSSFLLNDDKPILENA